MPKKFLIVVSEPLILTVCSLFLLLFTPVVHAENTEPLSTLQELQLVFSADYGSGEQIFFSSYQKNNWTIPVQISDSPNFVFHPVSGIGSDGKIWVVWTQADNKGKFLYYSVFSNSRWSQSKKIETQMKDNRSATLIVDTDNIPWLAWLAVEKTYSDVFWSRWNGSGWDSPIKAHADNNVPDIQPGFSLQESGRIRLSWQTFVDVGYVTASKIWDQQQSQLEQSVAAAKNAEKKIQERVELPALPSFIKEPHKATLFIKTDVRAEAVPLIRL
jgi:hypothetical protein